MKNASHLILLAALLPVAATAQLRQPPSPTETRAVSLPSSSPASSPTETRAVSLPTPPREQTVEDKEERSQPKAPARPARPVVNTKPKPKPVVVPQATRPVYNSNGQQVNGMRQAGPNRVLDTRTGRYYNTVPSGTGQRIVP